MSAPNEYFIELAKRVRRLSAGYQGMDDQFRIASELEALANQMGNVIQPEPTTPKPVDYYIGDVIPEDV